MKIDVNEGDYSNLSDDDKIRLFLFAQDNELHKKINSERKKLNITKDIEKQIYTVSSPETLEMSKNIQKSASNIIKKSKYLNERWLIAIFSSILSNRLVSLPSNYSVTENESGIQINITQPVSKNDLTDWINNNWNVIVGTSRVSMYFKRSSNKKYGLPKNALLKDVLEIYKLRSQGMSLGKIAESMHRTDKKYIENIYLRINKAIKKFEEEVNKHNALLEKLPLIHH